MQNFFSSLEFDFFKFSSSFLLKYGHQTFTLLCLLFTTNLQSFIDQILIFVVSELIPSTLVIAIIIRKLAISCLTEFASAQVFQT